jgi:hypothetical protein
MKDKVASNVIRTAGNLVEEYAVDRIGADHLMYMIEAKKAAAVFIA